LRAALIKAEAYRRRLAGTRKPAERGSTVYQSSRDCLRSLKQEGEIEHGIAPKRRLHSPLGIWRP
jgi:hypothetical protein